MKTNLFTIAFSVAFVCAIFSCTDEELTATMTFDELYLKHNIERPLSEKGEELTLSRYGSVEGYDIVLSNQKNKISASSGIKTKSGTNYTVEFESYYDDDHGVFQCSDEVYLLDRSEDEGFDWPFSDRAGASSACCAFLVSGNIDQSDQTFLDQHEMDMGYLLTCVSYPLSDIFIGTDAEDLLY